QLNEQRLQWIQRIKPKGSVLDIGSGRGYFLYHASQMGYKVKGFEISPLAVKYCEKHFHIKTTIQNIENGVNLNHKYDIITLWHVLEHLSNPLKVLTNLKLLLADNGILFIEVPNINSLKFLLSPRSKKWIGGDHPRYHRFFFSARTLSQLLSIAGYKNIKRKTTTYNLSHHKKIKILLKQSLKLFDLDSFINVYAY
ncbi:MAG: class I SAM-dependent methyltransferase, partial [Candidatus Hodarchaeota archaeon]